MPQHSTYFDGNVQSLKFQRHGRVQTVGVVEPGTYHFGTAAAERMTIVNGSASIRLDGTSEWLHQPAGTAFEIPAQSGFDIRCQVPTAYWCEFL